MKLCSKVKGSQRRKKIYILFTNGQRGRLNKKAGTKGITERDSNINTDSGRRRLVGIILSVDKD